MRCCAEASKDREELITIIHEYIFMHVHVQTIDGKKEHRNTYKDKIIMLVKGVEAIVKLYGGFHWVDSKEV